MNKFTHTARVLTLAAIAVIGLSLNAPKAEAKSHKSTTTATTVVVAAIYMNPGQTSQYPYGNATVPCHHDSQNYANPITYVPSGNGNPFNYNPYTVNNGNAPLYTPNTIGDMYDNNTYPTANNTTNYNNYNYNTTYQQQQYQQYQQPTNYYSQSQYDTLNQTVNTGYGYNAYTGAGNTYDPSQNTSQYGALITDPNSSQSYNYQNTTNNAVDPIAPVTNTGGTTQTGNGYSF